MKISALTISAGCAVLVAAAACHHKPRRSVDLLAHAWRADVAFERVGSSLFTDSNDPNLVDGWADFEGSGDDRVIWAVGAASLVRFHLNYVRALRITVAAQAYEPALVNGQRSMPIELNGTLLGELILNGKTFNLQTFELPAAVLRRGMNELHFRHPWPMRPSEAQHEPDMRPLAVLFKTLDLTATDEPPAVPPPPVIPQWTGDWYASEIDKQMGEARWAAQKGATLEFDAAPGVAGYRLDIQVMPYQPDGAAVQTLEILLNGLTIEHRAMSPGWQPLTLTLPGGALLSGRNRLAFRANHDLSPKSAAGVNDDRRLAFFAAAPRLGPITYASFPSGKMLSDPKGGLLLLPGTRLAYTMQMPAGATLHLAGEVAVPTGLLLDTHCASGKNPAEASQSVNGAFELTLNGCSEAGLGEMSISSMAPAGAVPMRLNRLSLEGDGNQPLWTEPPPVPPAPPPVNKPRTILIYLVDTLRADRLSVYGYFRPTSPALLEFSREAAIFDNAWSSTSWTKSAVASLLTGLEPDKHGAGEALSALDPRVAYLPAQFKPGGYKTAAVVTNSYVGPFFGFNRDWDDYRYFQTESGREPSSTVAANELTKILEENGRTPMFIYIHVVDPHFPYQPAHRTFAALPAEPPAQQTRSLDAMETRLNFGLPVPALTQISDLYDDEVVTADAGFAQVISLLKKSGRWDDALVVFTADHGEEFGEHGGIGHGNTLFPEVMRIPMLIRWPDHGQGGNHRVEPVSLYDIAPTLLADAGLPSTGGPGHSLHGTLPDRTLIARLTYLGRIEHRVMWGEWAYHRVESRATGQYFAKPLEYLFNYSADHFAKNNLADEQPLLTGYLRALSRQPPLTSLGSTEISDPETLKNLKALGYLQ